MSPVEIPKETAAEPALRKRDNGLTIPAAKEGLAQTFDVRPEAIEITIRD